MAAFKAEWPWRQKPDNLKPLTLTETRGILLKAAGCWPVQKGATTLLFNVGPEQKALRGDWENSGINIKMARLPVEGSQDGAELMFSVEMRSLVALVLYWCTGVLGDTSHPGKDEAVVRVTSDFSFLFRVVFSFMFGVFVVPLCCSLCFGPPPSTNFTCVLLSPPSIFHHIVIFSLVFIYFSGFLVSLWFAFFVHVKVLLDDLNSAFLWKLLVYQWKYSLKRFLEPQYGSVLESDSVCLKIDNVTKYRLTQVMIKVELWLGNASSSKICY